MKKIEKVNLILTEQEEQMKKYDEAVTQYTNMSKKVISEINLKKLRKVKRTPEIENLFRFFYSTLYFEDESTFNYDKFIKTSMGSKIEDFQVRLARFEINKLERHHRE